MTELPTGEGYHWNEQLVHDNYDGALDAVLAGKEAELDAQFERPVPDVTGIPPWSEASAEWLAAQPTIDELHHQLDES